MPKPTQEQIENKLIQCIADITSASHVQVEITSQTPLADVGIDSLGLVEIFVFIEKNFNLPLLDANLKREDIETIHSLAAFVEGRI